MRRSDEATLFSQQKAQLRHQRARSSISNYGVIPDGEVVTTPGLPELTLYCGYLRKSVLREKFFQRRRNQDFLSIEYISEGEIHIRSGALTYVAEAGDLCLLHPNLDNDLLYLPGQVCRKYGLIIYGKGLGEVMTMMGLEDVNTVKIRDGAALEALFARMRGSLRNCAEAGVGFRMAGEVFELFQTIAAARNDEKGSGLAAEIRERLERDYAQPLKMRELAAEFKVSLPIFNRCFEERFALTPYQYLIRQRMNHAAALLREGELSIKEAAARSGYNTPLHFSAEFHRIYGCPPREYRRRARKSSAGTEES